MIVSSDSHEKSTFDLRPISYHYIASSFFFDAKIDATFRCAIQLSNQVLNT